jgi:hypothetical protein
MQKMHAVTGCVNAPLKQKKGRKIRFAIESGIGSGKLDRSVIPSVY